MYVGMWTYWRATQQVRPPPQKKKENWVSVASPSLFMYSLYTICLQIIFEYKHCVVLVLVFNAHDKAFPVHGITMKYITPHCKELNWALYMRHYLIYCSIHDSHKKCAFSSTVQFALIVCKLLQTPLFYFSGNWQSNQIGLIWRFVTSFSRILCTDKINRWPFHHSHVRMGSHVSNSHSFMCHVA